MFSTYLLLESLFNYSNTLQSTYQRTDHNSLRFHIHTFLRFHILILLVILTATLLGLCVY